MGVLADWQIEQERIFEPFVDFQGQEEQGVVTYGASSYGYDVRAGNVFYVFSNVRAADGVVDPKAFDAEMLEEIDTTLPNRKGEIRNYCLIPPNNFVLCHTIEKVRVPRDCLAVVVGKSTYARCGLIVNCTPLEPEWWGHVTIEVSNTTPLPARVYANEGIAQVLLLRADGVTQGILEWAQHCIGSTGPDERLGGKSLAEVIHERLCRRSYQDKKGRYQGQKAQVTIPFVRQPARR